MDPGAIPGGSMILPIIGIVVGVCYVVWMSWPAVPESRCTICGLLSDEDICSDACRARVLMRVQHPLHEMHKDEFGF